MQLVNLYMQSLHSSYKVWPLRLDRWSKWNWKRKTDYLFIVCVLLKFLPYHFIRLYVLTEDLFHSLYFGHAYCFFNKLKMYGWEFVPTEESEADGMCTMKSLFGIWTIFLANVVNSPRSTGSGQFKHWAALLGIREPIFQPVVAFYCLYYRLVKNCDILFFKLQCP